MDVLVTVVVLGGILFFLVLFVRWVMIPSVEESWEAEDRDKQEMEQEQRRDD